MSVTEQPTPELVKDHEQQWSDHVQQLAFELWMHETGRSIPAVHQRLKEEFNVTIPERTLRDWKRKSWDGKAQEQIRLVGGAYQEQTLGKIVVAAYHGIEYVDQVILGLVFPDPNRIRASQIAMAAAGFGTHARREPLPAALPIGEAGEEGTLDRSALLERERKRRSGE